MSKKNTPNPIVLSPEIMSRMADHILKAFENGKTPSKNGILNTMAAVSLGPNRNWGAIKGAGEPIYAQGLNVSLIKEQLGAGQKLPEQIHVAIWTHRHGITTQACLQEEDVEAYRQEIAEDNWSMEMGSAQKPDDPAEAADKYFSEMEARQSEFFEVQQTNIAANFTQSEPEGARPSALSPLIPAFNTVWQALDEVRARFLPSGTPKFDKEWQFVKNTMVNLETRALCATPETPDIPPEGIHLVWGALEKIRTNSLTKGDFDNDQKWGRIVDAFQQIADTSNPHAANWEGNRKIIREKAADAFSELLETSHRLQDLRDDGFFESMTVDQNKELAEAVAHEFVRQMSGAAHVTSLAETGAGGIKADILDSTVDHHIALMREHYENYKRYVGHNEVLKL